MSLRHQCQELKEKIDQKDPSKKRPYSRPHARYSIGIELVASFITGCLVAWGLGHFLTLSPMWRVIIGFLLGGAANGMLLYRITKND